MKLNEQQKSIKLKVKGIEYLNRTIQILKGELEWWQKLNIQGFNSNDNILKHIVSLKLYIEQCEMQKQVLSKLIVNLTNTELLVLDEIYNKKHSLTKASFELNYSERQIKRIHQQAIIKLSELTKD